MYIKFQDNDLKYFFSSVKECVNYIVEEYHKDCVSMWDILATSKISDITLEDAFFLYAECMKQSDNDKIVHFRDEINNNELNKISNNFEIIKIE